MKRIVVAEVFAGIGGVACGFMDAGGYDIGYLADNDPIARDAFAANFPALRNRYHLAAIESVTGPEIVANAGGTVDGLLGCPPCQGFSSVGLRKSNDKRNALLREMLRLVRSISPKFFVLENVPSLLNTSLYREFVGALDAKYDMASGVVNAAEYGLPQLRRRAVVLGFRRDLSANVTFPAPTHGGRGRVYDYASGKYVRPSGPSGRRLLQLRPSVNLPRGRALVTLRRALSDLPVKLAPGEERNSYERPAASAYQRLMRQNNIGVTDHRAWKHDPSVVELLSKVLPGECPRSQGSRFRNTTYFSQAYARLHAGGLSRTITTNFHNPGSGRFTHYAAARALTIREALRLQGFRDSFSLTDLYMSDAERVVGNAFPPPLARAFAKHIRRQLTL